MNNKRYYELLSIDKGATQVEIQKAYKKQSLKWHPDRNKTNKDKATERFQEISAAYQILSDPERRETYDMYGEQAAESGSSGMSGMGGSSGMSGMGGMGGMSGGVKFQFSSGGGMGGMGSDDLFQTMFSGENMGGMFRGTRSSQFTRRPRPKKSILTRDISLTLAELSNGCQKKLRLTGNGSDGHPFSKTFTIEVRPGWKPGTKATFPCRECGAEVVFTVKQLPHPYLERDNNDLLWTWEISKSQTSKSLKASIATSLKNEMVDITTKGLDITNGKKLIISGKGMPIKGKLDTRGDFVVTFQVS